MNEKLKPMLLSVFENCREKVFAEKYVFIQPKLDGWRAVINTGTGQIYSRTGNLINLPHITEQVLSMKNLPEFLDGEIYTHGFKLNEIQSMIKMQDLKLKFNCFDCITPGNFTYRLKKIMNIKETDAIKTVQTYRINPAEIFSYYREYLKMKLEGAVIRIDSEYFNGRTENILKLKPHGLN